MSHTKFSLLTKFKKSEIEALFQTSSLFFRSSFFILLSAPATLPYGRVLLVVSKKIGTAPQRNKLRRRMKAIFYEHKLYLYKKDIVFIAKSSRINQMSYTELQQKITSYFTK